MLHAQPVEEDDRVALALLPQLGVDALEQIAGAGVPAPPQVARQLLKRTEALGQRLIDHHAVPLGLLDEELLAHEVDLLVARAAAVEHHAVGARGTVGQGVGIGPVVVGRQVLPERRAGDVGGGPAHGVRLHGVEAREAQQRIGHGLLHLAVVVVVAAHDLHTRMFAQAVHPQAEARESRGERGHGESHRFERRVTPRLVIRGEDRDIHARQQFVIAHVEDAVGAVQVGGYEDHPHLRVGRDEHAVVQRADDRVPRHVFEAVRRKGVLRGIDGERRIGQPGLQILARPRIGRRHGDVGQHLAVEQRIGRQPLERREEHIEALVAELVAAARAHNEGLAAVLAAEACLRHADQGAARGGAAAVELLAAPHEAVLETVGRHAVHLAAQQVLALVGRDVADGEERIVVVRRGLFERVLGHDIEAPRQLVGVEFRQVGVERQPVAGDAAAQHRGMGGEHGGRIGSVAAQVEAARSGHPLVEMGHDLLRRGGEGLRMGGDRHARGIAEEQGLHIVPLARNGVHAVLLPEPFEDLVLAREERREIDQHHQGASLDAPAARTHADALAVEAPAPRLQQRGILLEFGVAPLVAKVGTDQDVAVAVAAGHDRSLGRNDGMDSADLVTHFPAHLEKVVGSQLRIAHRMYF